MPARVRSGSSGSGGPAPDVLGAVTLSRDPSEQRAFRDGLRKLPPSPGGPELEEFMTADYAISLNGVGGELFMPPILL